MSQTNNCQFRSCKSSQFEADTRNQEDDIGKYLISNYQISHYWQQAQDQYFYQQHPIFLINNSKIENNIQEQINSSNSERFKNYEKSKATKHNFEKQFFSALIYVLKCSSLSEPAFSESIQRKIYDFLMRQKKLMRIDIATILDLKTQGSTLRTAKISLNFLEDLVLKNKQQQVKTAQKQINKMLRATIQTIDWKQYVQSRRIKKKQQFLDYLSVFTRELGNGRIAFRMRKQKNDNQ